MQPVPLRLLSEPQSSDCTDDGSAYKVDATGKLLWSFKTAGRIYSPATIGPDGAVFVGTMRPDNCLYALNGASGRLKWKGCGVKGGGQMNSGAAIGEPGTPLADIVVMNNFDKHVYAFNRSTGALVWSKAGMFLSGGSATLHGSTVFIGSWSKSLYALDALNKGAELWTFAAGGEIESHPAYADGVVYTTAEESHALYALDSRSGKQLWKYDAPTQEMNGSPSLSKDLVFAGANDGFLHAVHRETGAPAFKVAMPEGCPNVFSSPAIADSGMIYFTCNSPTSRRRRRLGEGERVADPYDGDPQPGVGNLFAVNPALHM